ncbi:IclR family transcriptional regulator [Allopusillimonas ginsengisoli]|uniref:IclR family transcriptional regulator n=1 Tax=Allopusillimonas ginsengisoli TaxID=453575 RepID=UPI00101FC356|nr:IclR family transcriptional regulator [Allopusillimonas ginsengisoli]TEA78902.1 IclR family transcriptional regulator [Allopusillimonas ginsengisoli]
MKKDPLPVGRRPARRKRQPGFADKSSPDFVEALARGLSVMRCFQPGVPALGNLELAERTGLAKSTVSRIVYTLTTLGYLRYHHDTGQYSPDYGVLALGFGCLANLEVRQLARPLMEQLAKSTGAAVALGAFDGESMTYVEAVHGSAALYLRLPVGYRVGMNSTMGRAYLASLPAAERERLLETLSLPRGMSRIMNQACKDFALSGCCYGIGDWQPGINAVAAPFATPTGENVFVLSCGGPDSILSEPRLRGEITKSLNTIVNALAPSQTRDQAGDWPKSNI